MNEFTTDAISRRRGMAGSQSIGVRSAIFAALFWFAALAFVFMAQTVTAAYQSGVIAKKIDAKARETLDQK